MKIVTVIGARPQFVKAAVVSRALKKNNLKEVLVHTGQHYDSNMSDVFFSELEISSPAYNLGIGSGMHGTQTGTMLAGIEKIIMNELPDWVMVYGDTNSTLAGALAAAKLHIRIAHVEAGLRSFNRLMPEEINRVLTDHISELLFCPSAESVGNLQKEGIIRGVHMVGDVMYDAVRFAVEKNKLRPDIFGRLKISPKKFILVTMHRAETTDFPERLESILELFNTLKEEVVFPVHPRTRNVINQLKFQPGDHVHLIEPVGYFDMVQLEESARMILTDSGGVQKEAYWLKTPCLTLRTETEWVETVQTGWNKIVGFDTQLIRAELENWKIPDEHPMLYAQTDCSEKIVSLLAGE